MGYESREIVVQHHRIFCDSVYAASAEYHQFWSDLKAGQFKTGEFRRVTRDGRQVWIQASYNPVVDALGVVRPIVTFATDITAAKEAATLSAGYISAIDRSQATIVLDLDAA